MPHTAFIWVTGRCNARCWFCHARRHGLDFDMSPEGYLRALSLLYDLGVERLVFVGGEPLILEPDRLSWMVREAYEHGFRWVEAETNGSLLASRVDAVRRMDYVWVSLDYAGPRQEEVRGVKVWDGFWEVYGRCENVGITSVYLLDNLPDIMFLARAAMDRGRRYTVKTCKPGYEDPSAPHRVLALYEAVIALYRETGYAVSVVDEPGFYAYASLALGGRPKLRCGGGTEVLTVLPDGSISPCPYDVPAVLGNAFKDGYLTVQEAIAAYDLSKRPRGVCARCRMRRYGCVGCPISDNLHCPIGRGLV